MELLKIPIDLIICHIFPNSGIANTLHIICVCKLFHKNKRKIHMNLIKNDAFLSFYTRFYKINLIHIIHESSFSFECFDLFYNSIKYNSNTEYLFNEEYNTLCEKKDQYQINNTFILFKILKLSIHYAVKQFNIANQNKYSYIIMNEMKKYFKQMYFARNGGKYFTSFMDEIYTNWERSNLNLYNICEDLNLMCYSNKSDVLNQNLQMFDCTIVNQNGYQTRDSTICIHSLFINQYQPAKVYIYVHFIIFKYLNIVFRENMEQSIIKDTKYLKKTKDIMNTYEKSMNNTYSELIPSYFHQMILNEINDYKTNIQKHI